MKRINNKKVLILLIFGISFGLFWGVIYLFLFDLHGMARMFNNEFNFLLASVAKLNITGKSMGFVMSFSDGFLAGILFGLLFVRLVKPR